MPNSRPERLHFRQFGQAALMAVFQHRADPLGIHDVVDMSDSRRQARDGEHGARAAGFEVANLLVQRVGHARGAQPLCHGLGPPSLSEITSARFTPATTSLCVLVWQMPPSMQRRSFSQVGPMEPGSDELAAQATSTGRPALAETTMRSPV